MSSFMQIIVWISEMGSGEEKSTRSFVIAHHGSITSVSLLLEELWESSMWLTVSSKGSESCSESESHFQSFTMR